jgi:uncharacterized OB-fold protein
MNSPIKTWRDHKKISELLGKKGKIVSWTRIQSTQQVIALIELENGERLTSEVVDFSGSVKIGQRVIAVTRRESDWGDKGVISYGITFKGL